MSFHQVVNNAKGSLAADLTSGGASMVVNSNLDSIISALTFPYFLTIWKVNTDVDNLSQSGMEIVEVTARTSPGNYLINRGLQGTIASSHYVGDNVAMMWTQGNIEEAIPLSSNNAQGALPFIGSNGLPTLLTPGLNGQYLNAQGNNANPIFKALKPNNQFFSSSGSFTVPNNVYNIIVSGCAGGGGGSGNSDTADGYATVGIGGNAGQYVWKEIFAVTPGNILTITIGAGGSGGMANGSTLPTAGGNTSLGALLTLTGGAAAAVQTVKSFAAQAQNCGFFGTGGFTFSAYSSSGYGEIQFSSFGYGAGGAPGAAGFKNGQNGLSGFILIEWIE